MEDKDKTNWGEPVVNSVLSVEAFNKAAQELADSKRKIEEKAKGEAGLPRAKPMRSLFSRKRT